MNIQLDWLYHETSMTDKLKTFGKAVKLEIISHQWEATNEWDKQKLNLASDNILHREILMWADKEPCWYARTIMPLTTYEAKDSPFERLKTEALGNIIWSSSDIKRLNMQRYTIAPGAAEYTWLTPRMHENTSPLWVRLSTFRYREKDPFYLLETLLPGLMRVTAENQ